MLAYQIQKITKMFSGHILNSLKWIEAEEDDRDWRDHSSKRWNKKHKLFIKQTNEQEKQKQKQTNQISFY